MKKIKKWIRQKLRTFLGVDSLSLRINNAESMMLSAHRGICETRDELKKNSRLDADIGVHPKSNNTIILSGVYAGRAYVRFYDIGDGDFMELRKSLIRMSRDHRVRNLDTPPTLRGSFDASEWK